MKSEKQVHNITEWIIALQRSSKVIDFGAIRKSVHIPISDQ